MRPSAQTVRLHCAHATAHTHPALPPLGNGLWRLVEEVRLQLALFDLTRLVRAKRTAKQNDIDTCEWGPMQAPYENSSGLPCGRIKQGFDRMGGDCAILVRARVPSNFAHLRVPPRALVNFAHGAIEDFLGPAHLAPPHLLQRHRFAHNDEGTMSACAGKGQDTGSGVAR